MRGRARRSDRLVDVLAVAPRADVAQRIERCAAQRAGWAACRNDPGRPLTNDRAAAAVIRTRSRSGPSSSSSSSSSGSIASPSSSWARASTRTRSAPPSQPSVSEPARKASLSGSSSGPPQPVPRPPALRRHPSRSRRCRAGRARRGASPRRSARTATCTFSSATEHDPAALAGLEEERSVARLTDRAGHEPVGRIEDVATSGHAPDSIRESVG